MKKFILSVAIALLICGCSKEYDDSKLNGRIDSLEQRLSAMETVMRAYENNLFIQSVQAIDDGYIITFSDGSKATITNGRNGQNGTDGKDGKDGVDGTNGKDGADGDSMFSNVDTSDPNYVVFTLSDGSQIKLPTWAAFEALQTLCNQMNTNLNALTAIVEALEKNDYITSVDPLTENGLVVGYTIKFAKSNPIVIYNGKDGISGTAPEIGIKKDTDGLYYWTLNGEFMVVDGQKIRAQGKDGANGTDGTNGTTPKLKIEEGYWWISYNDGADWTKLDKATGEDGKDADSITITQDEDNVYFHLPDGTIITIAKKESYMDSSYIHFEDAAVEKICITRWDTNSDYRLSYEEAAAVTNLGEAFQGNKEIEFFDELKYFTGLATLNDNVFKECSNLLKVTIPANIYEISVSAFKNCKNLTRVIFDKESQLKKIAGCAANASVQEGTFAETGIITIEIPASVEIIEPYAFGGCSKLETIIFEKNSQLTTIRGGHRYTYDYGTRYNGAFANCTALTTITLPARLETIEYCAFRGCKNLQSIAFEVGSQLKVIKGENNSPNNEYYGAFSGLKELVKFDASNCTQITQIEDSAFWGDSNLQEIRIGTITPPKASGNSSSTYPFNDSYEKAILYVPKAGIADYQNTYAWKMFLNIKALDE